MMCTIHVSSDGWSGGSLSGDGVPVAGYTQLRIPFAMLGSKIQKCPGICTKAYLPGNSRFGEN